MFTDLKIPAPEIKASVTLASSPSEHSDLDSLGIITTSAALLTSRKGGVYAKFSDKILPTFHQIRQLIPFKMVIETCFHHYIL